MRDTKTPSIPLHSRLVPLYVPGDRSRHSLEFGVVGVEKSAKVIIVSDLFHAPEIEERITRGGIDLPDRLMDALAISVFRVMAGFIIDYDGHCATWTAADAVRWIRKHYATLDAEQIIGALSQHVSPDRIVKDAIVVGDDDVVLADDSL